MRRRSALRAKNHRFRGSAGAWDCPTNWPARHNSATSWSFKPDGSFAKADESIDCAGEPDHDGLCLLEQKLFLDAIQNDHNLSDHMSDAVDSLRIVLAADEAFRTGRTVEFPA